MFRPLFKSFLGFFIVFIAIAVLFGFWNSPKEKAEVLDITSLVTAIQKGEVKEVTLKSDTITLVRADGSRATVQKERGESFSELLKNYGIAPEKMTALKIHVEEESGWRYWLANLLPAILPVLLIALLLWLMARQVQGVNNRAMMFGQSGAREQEKEKKEKITFKDVAGAKEAKEELEEIVEFLKNPKKFTTLGAKIPKGVLLMGAPGTGKTLLAKAVAGEARVPFFSISGSEFVEMFVGVGAARVRDLFRRSQKSAPCIIFIDEIDAVGRQRGSGIGGSHDEREQTLNQILVEMDGFEPNSGVIIIAATNRPDVLDPALLRPGRFDRRIVIDEPDMRDRKAILDVHARNKPLAPDVSLQRVAERTPGFSGADLANLFNEAAILAARRNKKRVEMSELLESIEKVLLGPERKGHVLSEHEKKVTAYHEAGHALVAKFSKDADPVHKISIISRGRAGGYTLKLPIEDRHLRRRAEFIADLAVYLGGYVAEQDIFGDVTTGASNDLHEATRLARRLITEYGMSAALGPRTFGEREELVFLGRQIHEERNYSEKTAESIDKEMSKFIADAMRTARSIIKNQRTYLEKIVAILLEKETIEKEEFESIFSLKKHNKKLTPPKLKIQTIPSVVTPSVHETPPERLHEPLQPTIAPKPLSS